MVPSCAVDVSVCDEAGDGGRVPTYTPLPGPCCQWILAFMWMLTQTRHSNTVEDQAHPPQPRKPNDIGPPADQCVLPHHTTAQEMPKERGLNVLTWVEHGTC